MTEASQAVVEACRLLSSEERVETRNLAAAIGLSSSYFQRCFKRQLGVAFSPSAVASCSDRPAQ